MSPIKRGFIQALGVALYCLLVGLFFQNVSTIFPGPDPYLAPVIMLLLLSSSALICALLVFYFPVKLFFEGKKKEALQVIVDTAGWLIFMFVFLISIVFKFPSIR